jgi:hypothetical protein
MILGLRSVSVGGAAVGLGVIGVARRMAGDAGERFRTFAGFPAESAFNYLITALSYK